MEDNLLACEIMPQTILTLVENALKHGIYKKEKVGTISIDIHKENQSLVIKITDTGIGIKQGITDTGYGIYSVQERLKLYYKDRDVFTIKALSEGGT